MHGTINTKKNLLTLTSIKLEIQFVPRSKHTPSQLQKPVS